MTESPAVIGAMKLLSRMLSQMNANYKDSYRQNTNIRFDFREISEYK